MLTIVIYRQLIVSVENARLRSKIVTLTQTIALSSSRDELGQKVARSRED